MPIPSESLSAGRDWLYAAALFLGAGLTVPTFAVFRREPRRTRRGGLWSVSCVLLAAAAAAASRSFIYFGAVPIAEPSLLRTSAALVILSSFSLRFPRAIGFPVVVASGAAVAIFAAVFLYLLPCAAGSPIGLMRVDSGRRAEVRFEGSSTAFLEVPSSAPAELLRLEAFEVDFNRAFPLVGGSRRMALFSVRGASSAPLRGGRVPVSLTDFFRSALIPGIRSSVLTGEIDPSAMHPGTRAFLLIQEGEIIARIVR